jgi:hypothetical protein
MYQLQIGIGQPNDPLGAGGLKPTYYAENMRNAIAVRTYYRMVLNNVAVIFGVAQHLIYALQ